MFRGITVAGMLLVNNPGSWGAIYAPLRHAEWHGWTPTDLVFPFFLFIVGVSMAFSLLARAEAGQARGPLLARAAKRGAILVLLGLALAAFPWVGTEWSSLRFPGVLQRIGVAFALAAAAALYLRPRALAGLAAALLLGYWAAMALVPVPGAGAGRLDDPGGTLAAYVDRAVFGTRHLWAAAGTWDPEGLLSTIPAVVTVLLGVFAGRWMRRTELSAERRLVGMFLAANALTVAGWVWGAIFPVNKSLWTSSYVLLTGGLALHALALCWWAVDLHGGTRWSRPFLVLGVNAIAAFWLSGAMARTMALVTVGGDVSLKAWIFTRGFASWLPPKAASLAFAMCFVGFWMAMMEGWYRKGIVWKV